MTDRELMQQALRYMESIGEMDTYPEDWAIAIALRERLAQPEQEPVAWGVFDGPNLHDTFFTEEDAQYMVKLKGDGSVVKPLYTSPPASKPLTDEEIYDMYNEPRSDAEMIAFARAIEAAHGIKGEA